MLKMLLLVLVIVGVYLFITKFSTKGISRRSNTLFTRLNKQKIGEPLTIDDDYNGVKVNKKKEMNRILDKIGKRGIGSTTKKEKEFMDEYSDKL